MNKIKILFALIGKRTLAKYFPQILAWLLTKVFVYTLETYPEKTGKVIETSEDISKAFEKTVNSVKDGKVTARELEQIKYAWIEVFK